MVVEVGAVTEVLADCDCAYTAMSVFAGRGGGIYNITPIVRPPKRESDTPFLWADLQLLS